jgi:uracil-DNA glycosylase family protein
MSLRVGSPPVDHRQRQRQFAVLKEEAGACHECPLWRDATQTVFGDGPTEAPVMLVGEQPGDHEDLEGQPFVGPAGKLLDQALSEAGLGQTGIYRTNVVKHFKYRQQGKRRLHQRPSADEVRACRPWLDAELALVRPRVLVCLGATAARALLGPDVTVRNDRGRLLKSPLAPAVLLTAHPSSVLRERDSAAREVTRRALVEDLRVAAGAL